MSSSPSSKRLHKKRKRGASAPDGAGAGLTDTQAEDHAPVDHTDASLLPDAASGLPCTVAVARAPSLYVSTPSSIACATTVPYAGECATTVPYAGECATTVPYAGECATTVPYAGKCATTVPDAGECAGECETDSECDSEFDSECDNDTDTDIDSDSDTDTDTDTGTESETDEEQAEAYIREAQWEAHRLVKSLRPQEIALMQETETTGRRPTRARKPPVRFVDDPEVRTAMAKLYLRKTTPEQVHALQRSLCADVVKQKVVLPNVDIDKVEQKGSVQQGVEPHLIDAGVSGLSLEAVMDEDCEDEDCEDDDCEDDDCEDDDEDEEEGEDGPYDASFEDDDLDDDLEESYSDSGSE